LPVLSGLGPLAPAKSVAPAKVNEEGPSERRQTQPPRLSIPVGPKLNIKRGQNRASKGAKPGCQKHASAEFIVGAKKPWDVGRASPAFHPMRRTQRLSDAVHASPRRRAKHPSGSGWYWHPTILGVECYPYAFQGDCHEPSTPPLVSGRRRRASRPDDPTRRRGPARDATE
jgi:hypothetical protein